MAPYRGFTVELWALGVTSMSRRETEVRRILAIAKATSYAGEGISLSDALRRSDYAGTRPGLGVTDLLEMLGQHPEFVTDWVAYSQDKRTSGGWYLLATENAIGMLDDPHRTISLDTLEQAVSEYVLHELDFWYGIESDS